MVREALQGKSVGRSEGIDARQRLADDACVAAKILSVTAGFGHFFCSGGLWNVVLLPDAKPAENAIQNVVGHDSADHGTQFFHSKAQIEGDQLVTALLENSPSSR